MSAALTSYPAYNPSGVAWLESCPALLGTVQVGPACGKVWADAETRCMEPIPLQDRSRIAGVGRRKAGLNRRFQKFVGGA